MNKSLKRLNHFRFLSPLAMESSFFEYIRKEHNINMLSESEYLNAHREELIKSGCQEVKTPLTDSFDFAKITVNKIVDTKTACAN